MGKTEEKTRKKTSAFFVFTVCVLTVGIFLSQIVSVGCNVYQNEINAELRKQEKILAEEINNGKQLEIEIDRRSDKFAVESYAAQNLHMQKVQNYQVQYVRSEQTSCAELLATEENSVLEAMVKPFSIIWSFFGE